MWTNLMNALGGQTRSCKALFSGAAQRQASVIDRAQEAGIGLSNDRGMMTIFGLVRLYLGGARAVCEGLFSAERGQPALCTEAELRALTPSHADWFISMFGVGMVRLTMPNDPKIADVVIEHLLGIMPDALAPAARRLSEAMREQQPDAGQNVLFGVLKPLSPRLEGDPVARIQFGLQVLSIAAALRQMVDQSLPAAAWIAYCAFTYSFVTQPDWLWKVV